MHLLGLDIGTTSCKAIIFNETGEIKAQASREYSVDFPHPNWAEQNIENVWLLALDAIREAISRSRNSRILALAISAHGEAITPVDAQGRAIRSTILGMDTRTYEQNNWLRENLGAENLYKETGMPVHTINTLPKLLWLKQNEPEIWKHASRFLLVEDFFIQKMTGDAVLSQCLASRTQLYDLQRGAWSEKILNAIGLDPNRLSIIKPSGIALSKMKSDLADSLGLAHPPLIVTGGHDQACCALGAGIISPGLAMVSTGTAEVVEAVVPDPNFNDALFNSNISLYSHVVPGLYLVMTLNHSGGMCLRWFRDNFCKTDIENAKEMGLDVYDVILEDAPVFPTSLLVLPHFSGSGTPYFDTDSKAAILGLRFSSNRAEIAKAILEGVTYELRLNLNLLKQGGVRIDNLRAVGGGAKSALWLQIKADILGIPVSILKITEAAGLGAAILAGIGKGIFLNASDAIKKILKVSNNYYPNIKNEEIYNHHFRLYQEVYKAISPITHSL